MPASSPESLLESIKSDGASMNNAVSNLQTANARLQVCSVGTLGTLCHVLSIRAAQSQNQELLREKKDLSEIIQRKNNELDAKTVEYDQLLVKNRALTEANLEAKRTR